MSPVSSSTLASSSTKDHHQVDRDRPGSRKVKVNNLVHYLEKRFLQPLQILFSCVTCGGSWTGSVPIDPGCGHFMCEVCARKAGVLGSSPSSSCSSCGSTIGDDPNFRPLFQISSSSKSKRSRSRADLLELSSAFLALSAEFKREAAGAAGGQDNGGCSSSRRPTRLLDFGAVVGLGHGSQEENDLYDFIPGQKKKPHGNRGSKPKSKGNKVKPEPKPRGKVKFTRGKTGPEPELTEISISSSTASASATPRSVTSTVESSGGNGSTSSPSIPGADLDRSSTTSPHPVSLSLSKEVDIEMPSPSIHSSNSNDNLSMEHDNGLTTDHDQAGAVKQALSSEQEQAPLANNGHEEEVDMQMDVDVAHGNDEPPPVEVFNQSENMVVAAPLDLSLVGKDFKEATSKNSGNPFGWTNSWLPLDLSLNPKDVPTDLFPSKRKSGILFLDHHIPVDLSKSEKRKNSDVQGPSCSKNTVSSNQSDPKGAVTQFQSKVDVSMNQKEVKDKGQEVDIVVLGELSEEEDGFGSTLDPNEVFHDLHLQDELIERSSSRSSRENKASVQNTPEPEPSLKDPDPVENLMIMDPSSSLEEEACALMDKLEASISNSGQGLPPEPEPPAVAKGVGGLTASDEFMAGLDTQLGWNEPSEVQQREVNEGSRSNGGTPKREAPLPLLASTSKRLKRATVDSSPTESSNLPVAFQDDLPLDHELLQLSIPGPSPPSPPKMNCVFCTTRLSRLQLKKLEELRGICGDEARIVRDYSSDVTHLILDFDEDKGIPYTVKYLYAIADHKWIVVFGWVEECLKEGFMVPEECFETSNFPHCDLGAQKSRIKKNSLLEGFNFYIGGYDSSIGASAQECHNLLIKLGARVLGSLDEGVELGDGLLILGDPTKDKKKYMKWFTSSGWLTVSWEWILDAVVNYEIVPFTQRHLLVLLDPKRLAQAHLPLALLRAFKE